MAIQKKVIGAASAGGSTSVGNAKENMPAKTSGWTEFSKHIMTGISYMIPMLIMGGLIGAISQIIPYGILNINPSTSIVDAINSGKYTGGSFLMLQMASVMEIFGFTLFGFAIPVFAAFTANSIGGKTALAAGFIGGYIATKPVAVLTLVDGKWANKAPVASGFLGAILIAFIIGYFVKWLNQKINLPHNWLAFKVTFLIPLISALACLVLMVFIITPFGGWINTLIRSLLQAAGSSGQYAYALVLAAATAFDLGGPVNKAAGFVALGFTTEQVLPITARCLAIVIPSFGLGLSTLIDKKLVGRSVYDKQFDQVGKTAIFLAFMGISEGAIPFALEKPAFCIPLYVMGAIVGAISAIAMGAVQWFPESAIWAWPLVKGIIPYILGLIIGSVFIAVINVLYRNKLIKEGQLVVNE
ncbi:phosphotransferase system eiic [Lucifera butyrica]|uniref:Phosphotransferase system eiic n=1 Tax=Lucifera butyrica TaxID=1351585 RepID=A0A498RF22_9FIRM|nr:PTS fructose transporter subunit IIC [Lucifera butyrica]VBB09605.1 phosphotransferase system eiic [Lucifera butyrica]